LTLSGATLVAAGTWLHPTNADPNDSLAAFTEYAETHRASWVASHLIQLGGLVAILLVIVLLTRALAVAPRSGLALVTTTAAAATIAVAAVLQAVDGVALKASVDRWADATQPEKPSLFAASLAVRDVEIGLAALSSLLLGFTTLAFGLAIWRASDGRHIVEFLLLAASAILAVGGAIIAVDGFSAAGMNLTSLGGILAAIGTGAAAARARRVLSTSSSG